MTYDYAENFLELEISMEVSTTLLSLLTQRCHGRLRLLRLHRVPNQA